VGRHRDEGASGLPTVGRSADEGSTDLGLEIEDALGEASDVNRTALSSEGGGPRGDLSVTRAPEVLHGLYVQAVSGGLLLARGPVKKVVYLRDGYPVAVKSNVIGECLGKILTWEGIITQEDYRRSLVAMRESGVRQGSALIRMGALTHRELAHGLDLQLRFKLCETFSWSQGSYQVWPGIDAPAEAVPLSLSPAALVFEGVRSFMPQPEILAALRRLADRYLHPSEDPLLRFQDVGAREGSETLLALVDGTATASDLVRSSSLDVRETAALLYTLVCTGIVEARPGPAERPSALFDPEVEPDPPTDRAGQIAAAHRVDLAKLVARLRGSAPQEILGIERGATPIEVRRAYFERALERHPDRMGAGAGLGIRELGETALRLTAEAYALVSGESIGRGHEPRVALVDAAIDARVRSIVEAEGYHQAGIDLLDRGRPEEAKAMFTRAVAACEQEGDFRTSLAWASFQAGLDAGSAADALGLLDEAIQRSPALVRAHLYRGHILRFLEREEDSARAFEEALRRDPTNEEAISELARIQESSLLRGGGDVAQ
jgi:tetratricopeptide (TPR) repeat protein